MDVFHVFKILQMIQNHAKRQKQKHSAENHFQYFVYKEK